MSVLFQPFIGYVIVHIAYLLVQYNGLHIASIVNVKIFVWNKLSVPQHWVMTVT